jgi:hypothetical protein
MKSSIKFQRSTSSFYQPARSTGELCLIWLPPSAPSRLRQLNSSNLLHRFYGSDRRRSDPHLTCSRSVAFCCEVVG